ncbi:hypothetical protein I3271_04450 [Photobacterium leiognathi]|uniref:hypothetical protein n=1 Tax=Photobacterium leiognathi TaxID=553611 RepID=UPI001EDE33F4|nr:hypothetical protein [Photobacterium leiognathi]MCG3883936.1 hypothetical protein [Photobacterium leiognathi]
MFDFSTGYCNNGGYAGIGSRHVSKFVTEKQAIFAFCMTLHGFKLFSGGVDGSDYGFEYGAKLAYDFLCKIDNSLPSGDYDRVMQIYLPWPGFNLRSGSGYTVPKNTSKSMAYAQQFHSNWFGLSDAGKQLMVRNSHQVLGSDLRTPVSFVVICHTSDGATHASATMAITGGTEQAIRVASANAISVCNTGNPSNYLRIEAKIRNASQIILERFGMSLRNMCVRKCTATCHSNYQKNLLLKA